MLIHRYFGGLSELLRAKTAKRYLDVDLRSEDGWARIERAIETLTRAYLGHSGTT